MTAWRGGTTPPQIDAHSFRRDLSENLFVGEHFAPASGKFGTAFPNFVHQLLIAHDLSGLLQRLKVLNTQHYDCGSAMLRDDDAPMLPFQLVHDFGVPVLHVR